MVKPAEVAAGGIVDNHRRTKAVEAERSAVLAEVDADVAERTKAIAPDLRVMAQASIDATNERARLERERADKLRAHAGMTPVDFPDLSGELEQMLRAATESFAVSSEQAAYPELYATPQLVGSGQDPALSFRWTAATDEARIAALKAAIAKQRKIKRAAPADGA